MDHTVREQPERKSAARQTLAIVFGIAVSVLFLVLAFRGLQPQAFLSSLAEVSIPLLLVGAAVYFIAVTIIAMRWQFLLNTVKHVPLFPLTQIVTIGYMGNNVYPLRAGEALRVFLLRRNHDINLAGGATTVIIERAFDGIVMLTFILIGLSLTGGQSAQIQQVVTIATPIFALAAITFFVLAAVPDVLRALVQFVARLLPEALGALILRLSDGMIEGLSSLRSPLQLLGAVISSYATWAVEALVYWIVMQAFGLELGYPVALLVVGTVNLAGLIPASPGQVGVYEFFASSVLIAFGIEESMALAYAIVVHIVIWLPVTLVGFGFLVRQGLGWTDIRRARASEEGEPIAL